MWGRWKGAFCALALCVATAAGQDEFSLESLGASDVEPQDANEIAPPKRSSWDRLTDNLRLAIDLSSRSVVGTDGGDWTFRHFAGFDIYKVFSLPDGDWGTLILQGYLTRVDDAFQGGPYGFFEGEDDWEFVYRIFNFNYTALPRQSINFRIGHFEVPFGLEQVINTNGTLRQYMHSKNIGVKADWGFSVNGVTDDIDYEVAIMRGTGNEWSSRGGPFLFAGRVGTSSEENRFAGFSAYYGEIQSMAAIGRWRSGLVDPATGAGVGATIRRYRFAVDAMVRVRGFGFLIEITAGQDFDQEVITSLGEVHWQSRDERLLVYIQIKHCRQNYETGWVHGTDVSVGFRFAPDTHWALSASFDGAVETFSGTERNGSASFQFRYRF